MQGSDGYSLWCSQGHSSSHPRGSVFPEVVQYSWELLYNPGSLGPTSMKVTCLGLFLRRMQIRAQFHKVSGSGLLLHWWLPSAYSCGGHCLESVPTEVSCLGPVLQRSLAWYCSMEVPDLCLVLQRSLAQACSLGSHSLVLSPVEVAALGLLWLKLLTQACLSEGLSLGLAQLEVAGSGLLQVKLLAQACYHKGPWLEPSPTEVSGLGLVPWRLLLVSALWMALPLLKLLTQACPCGGCYLGPAPEEVADSSLFLWRPECL